MAGSPQGAARAVLVVDDDAEVRGAMREALEDEGYAVLEAAHGAAALEALRGRAEFPHLVLLDMMMPVMDGWAFLEHVGRDARLARLPVVIVSAAGRQRLEGAAEKHGVAALLVKPVTLDQLLDVVARCSRPT